MTLYKKNLGKTGENIAAEYLINHKYAILFRNFRTKFGEIDIIAEKRATIYFIEVKTRANLNKGKPYEAINNHKAYQLRKTATFFLLKNNFHKNKSSIGVISILLKNQNEYQLSFFESID